MPENGGGLYSLTVACYFGKPFKGKIDHKIYLKRPGEITEQICPKGTGSNVINQVDANNKYQCCIICSIKLNPGKIYNSKYHFVFKKIRDINVFCGVADTPNLDLPQKS